MENLFEILEKDFSRAALAEGDEFPELEVYLEEFGKDFEKIFTKITFAEAGEEAAH